ncbi:MAG: sugar transferase [Melioribacteraceae bacterium]|nr:sugar transferase [Melioribacteraceae bacterium]
MSAYYKKRLFDLLITIPLIIVTIPIQIIIYIIILIGLKENPIFIQERGMTISNFRFRIIKFRTIKSSQLKKVNPNLPKNNFLCSCVNFQFNKITGWLRRKGLDEIPQLYNILFGQMSLVGPRPLMKQELLIMKNEYPDYNERRNSFRSRPGLTGVWQIFGNRILGIKNLIELDSFYEMNGSLKMDFKILLITFLITTIVKKSHINFFRLIFSNKIIPNSVFQIANQSFSKI